MVAARANFFCERCGSSLMLVAEAPASYCAGCRMYLCSTCRGQDPNRCLDCILRVGARVGTTGTVSARRVIRDVHDAVTDLARLRTMVAVAPDRADVPQAVSAEWDVLRVRIAAASRSAEAALEGTAKRYAPKAGLLAKELTILLWQAESVMRDRPVSAEPAAVPGAAASVAPAPTAEDGHVGFKRRLVLFGTAVALLLLLWIGVIVLAVPEGESGLLLAAGWR